MTVFPAPPVRDTRRGAASFLGLGLLCLLAVIGWPRLAQAGDPWLRWFTVETPHFRIHYHSGLEGLAQHLANRVEQIQAKETRETGWTPGQRTELVISDDVDSANGFAHSVPYNLIHLYVTAPEDMSTFGNYEDWMELLVTHENTHVLHLDNARGLPAVLNAVLGKTYAPNLFQPKWIIEGWAVYLESKLTRGGRLRSSQFDMYLRADVLEGNFPALDQISSVPLRWPGGTLWYLYGGKFVEWVSKTYGEDTMAAIAQDYGQNIVPWGVNRSVQRATQRTYPELWEGWHQRLNEHYQSEVAAVQARGLRQGVKITSQGRGTAGPVFVPPCGGAEAGRTVYYFASDGHSPGGIYRVDLTPEGQALGRPQLVTRSTGSQISFDGNCSLVFDSVAPTARRYRFTDLFRLPLNKRAPAGTESARERLTVGWRARTADVAQNGRRIAYVTNRAGTSTLRIADYTGEGDIRNERALVPSVPYEQAYTPRFSPDGRTVVYGTWSTGGYRDIRVVESRTGKFFEIMHDRAVDQQPSFSPDGRTVLFTSDRTGISNVYAFDLATHRLWQVTNVVTGAFMPTVSADGKLLVYVGYHAGGFDLYSMAWEPSQWLEASPYQDPLPLPGDPVPSQVFPVKSDNPLLTLRPRSYSLQAGQGTFGQGLTLGTHGEDAAEHHEFNGSITLETNHGVSYVGLDYAYHRLPFDLKASVFNRDVPRNNYQYTEHKTPYVEHGTGITTGITLPIPGEYQNQSVSLSTTLMRYGAELPLGAAVDPWALTPRIPYRGIFSSVHLGYAFSNTQTFAYSISPERGLAVSMGLDVAGPEFGSESSLTAATARVRGYVPVPLLRHNVLAMALSGGLSTGTYARRGLYYAGGFTGGALLDAFTSGVVQSAFVLRGYTPSQFVGSQYILGNVEYRFPLLRPQRGLSTLPIYVQTLAGALFLDAGGAFNRLNTKDPWPDLHFGIGAELWTHLVFGYTGEFDVRLGYARGTDSHAVPEGQTYAVIASAF